MELKRVMPLIASVVLAMGLVAWGGGGAEVTEADSRPNIIFVMSNDQDTATLEKMPYVGSTFQNEATTFPNATFNYPLCCPSRASILRGQYTHNHGVWENTAADGGGYEAFVANGLAESNFPVWLDRAGYNTGGFGLYVNQYNPDKHGTPAGFDFFRFYSRDWNNRQIPSTEHRDRYVKDNAVRWLKENVDGPPLMMWVSFYAPHLPYAYDPAYGNRFTDEELPKPSSFNEQNVSDKPTYVSNWPLLTDADIAQLEKDHRNRLRGLLTIDATMQTMIESLREAGELENTYVVYWTDNGYMMGQHRLIYKRKPYIESISFPLLVRGPDVPEGTTDRRVVMNHDLAPTFADIANAPVPGFVDGRSMVPIFEGTGTWRDVGMIESSDPINSLQPPSYRGVREEDYTYVEYADGFKEYYDLRTDPYQLENGYGMLSDERKAQLAARLDSLKGCSGNACREAEGGPLPTTPTGLLAEPSSSGVVLEWADHAGDDLAGYNVYRANSEWGPFTILNAEPLNASGYNDTNAPIGRPSHYWITAVDRAGNESAPAAISAARLDTTPPDTTIDTGPRRFSTDPTPTFSFSATDDGSSAEELLYSYRVGDGQWSTYSSDTTATIGDEESLADGLRTFQVKAKDKAGNEDQSPAKRTFTVDTIAPTVVRVVPAEDGTVIDPVANLEVFFSEAVRARSVNANTIKLFEKGSSVPIVVQISYDAATRGAIVDPDADLVSGRSYRAVVGLEVRDLAGNQLDQNPDVVAGNQRKMWFFTAAG